MDAACVVGVDLGGTKLLAGSVDPRLDVARRTLRPMEGIERASQVVEAVRDAVEELRGVTQVEVEAVGLGIPCTIDRRSGVAVSSVHLPIVDLPFGDMVAERVGLPVFVDNDANLAALAEVRNGAARGANHAVMLTIGTGIGGGLVLDGELYYGSAGAAAELGHMVVDFDGPPCQGRCPNRGCLEAVASGSALGREARRLAAERPDSALGRAYAAGVEVTGMLATELAYDGDETAIEAIRLIGSKLGVGIANIVNIFDPEVVVVGGGVIAAGEMLLGPAREEMLARALPPGRDRVRVAPAEFGADAGMIGAAILAMEGLEERRDRHEARLRT